MRLVSSLDFVVYVLSGRGGFAQNLGRSPEGTLRGLNSRSTTPER